MEYGFIEGVYLIAQRRTRTLVVVHRQPLLEQWITQLSVFLDLEPKEIGRIGGGRNKPNGRLDVAMIQSLVRKPELADLLSVYGHVIVDECHHVPAASFERVISQARARYFTGLTATPQRRDGHHPILHMQLGPPRFTVDPRSAAARTQFQHKLIVRETGFRGDGLDPGAGIQEFYGALTSDDRRNELILDDVIQAVDQGRSPILLTERREHLAFFEERLVLATGRYIGEGFDDARLDTLFLTLPVSWKGTLVQYAGRLHRHHPGKREIRIYDYVDRDVPMLAKMFERRMRGYRAMGYTP